MSSQGLRCHIATLITTTIDRKLQQFRLRTLKNMGVVVVVPMRQNKVAAIGSQWETADLLLLWDSYICSSQGVPKRVSVLWGEDVPSRCKAKNTSVHEKKENKRGERTDVDQYWNFVDYWNNFDQSTEFKFMREQSIDIARNHLLLVSAMNEAIHDVSQLSLRAKAVPLHLTQCILWWNPGFRERNTLPFSIRYWCVM